MYWLSVQKMLVLQRSIHRYIERRANNNLLINFLVHHQLCDLRWQKRAVQVGSDNPEHQPSRSQNCMAYTRHSELSVCLSVWFVLPLGTKQTDSQPEHVSTVTHRLNTPSANHWCQIVSETLQVQIVKGEPDYLTSPVQESLHPVSQDNTALALQDWLWILIQVWRKEAETQYLHHQLSPERSSAHIPEQYNQGEHKSGHEGNTIFWKILNRYRYSSIFAEISSEPKSGKIFF